MTDQPLPPTFSEPGIHKATAGAAIDWIAAGWAVFKKAPGTWIALLLVLFVIQFVANLLPVVGPLAMLVLGPVFNFGLLLGVRNLDAGQPLTVGHLFAGFNSPRRNSLILLGLLTLVVSVVIGVGTAATLLGDLSAPAPELLDGQFPLISLGSALILLLLLVPVMAATLFVVPLVGLAEQSIGAALRLSLVACLRNWIPLLVWGLLGAAMVLLGVLALLVGLLVAGPVLMASYYRMYQAIFAPSES